VETFTIIDSVFWFVYEMLNTSHHHQDKLRYYRCFSSHSGSVMHTSHTFVHTLAYTHTYCSFLFRISYYQIKKTFDLAKSYLDKKLVWLCA